MRRAGGRPTAVLRSVLAAAGGAAGVALLLVLPLAPATASPLAPAGGLPGPEVVDRSTLTPILLGSGCAATSVVLPVAGPVNWSVLDGDWVVVDASDPFEIDPADTTRFRATLSQGARFTDGGNKAEWTVGPAGTDVVTGCTGSPSAPGSVTPSSVTSPPATSTTKAPAPTSTTAPRSAVPAPSPTGRTGGGGGTGGSGGDASPAGATSGSQADGATGTGSAAVSSSAGAGGDLAATSGGDASGTDEPVLALAQPSVETRVLSNSFTRPEVSATAAAVASPSGAGPAATSAPLAAVVALLAGSGLVAGLLLYRGARGTVRNGPRH